jgi:hypothetical protein
MPLTEEEREAALGRIDARLGENKETEADESRRRKVEIYDDLVHIETKLRTLHILQPTMGFALLYRERRGYFEDDEHGFGRLLVALKRMKEPGYVRALRMGDLIPDEEADEAMLSKDIYIEDKLEYYLAIETAMEWGEDEAEKKTMKLLELRMGLDSGYMERSLKLSNSPDTPLNTSSTECPSVPSET